MVQPLQGTATGQNAIVRVTYTHDAMIDLILQQPGMTQEQIAQYFGYTQGWVSRVMGSDAFNARLAQRKEEIVNPAIIASIDERLRGLAIQSIDVLQRKLEATSSPEIASKSLELTTKALGMGARVQNTAVQNNTFVVALPPKATDEKAWAAGAQSEAQALASRQSAGAGKVVDVVAKPVPANAPSTS